MVPSLSLSRTVTLFPRVPLTVPGRPKKKNVSHEMPSNRFLKPGSGKTRGEGAKRGEPWSAWAVHVPRHHLWRVARWWSGQAVRAPEEAAGARTTSPGGRARLRATLRPSTKRGRGRGGVGGLLRRHRGPVEDQIRRPSGARRALRGSPRPRLHPRHVRLVGPDSDVPPRRAPAGDVPDCAWIAPRDAFQPALTGGRGG